MSDEVLANRF